MKLLNCPFCGGEADSYHAACREVDAEGYMQGQWVVDCSKCGCNMEDHTTQSQAESAWNTRAPDPRVEGLVKALKEAFKEGLELGYRHGFGGNIEKGLWLNSKARAALAEYEKETEKK